MGTIHAVIFDWGHTLHDPRKQELRPDAMRVLQHLSIRYQLAIVSLASQGNVTERHTLVRQHQIERYFHLILFAQSDKDTLYHQAITRLALSANQVAIVDDRVIRGIRWGNIHGATTVWLRSGAYEAESPTFETGSPSYIIETLTELINIF